MWLESDTNMPGFEAMARQMIEGKTFFMEELGVETTDVWLPDSFGYTGSLPQIIRGVGSRWFLSQKLSWNDSDTMLHHTFFLLKNHFKKKLFYSQIILTFALS